MKDPGGAIFVCFLVLLPPAAVLMVIREQMTQLRQLFLSEIEKLRVELRPGYQPEKFLEPKVDQLESEVAALTARLEELSTLLKARKPDAIKE